MTPQAVQVKCNAKHCKVNDTAGGAVKKHNERDAGKYNAGHCR